MIPAERSGHGDFSGESSAVVGARKSPAAFCNVSGWRTRKPRRVYINRNKSATLRAVKRRQKTNTQTNSLRYKN
ncbi:MAG TPA: hypothetical protein DHU55_04560 [Blastocatellia bacterium]|nr:hypothetical protein [Blastocatellia bacterium]